MKKSLCFLALFLVMLTARAQAPSLSFDKQGKYIYYQLVESKGISKDTLAHRTKGFFTAYKKTIDLKSVVADTSFSARGKFVISKSASVLSHPSGEVSYNFVAELRDGKYRFWFTDFKFVPYQRDRYGNFVPVSTLEGDPLEKTPTKLNAAEWKSYINSTAEQAAKLGNAYKEFLARVYSPKGTEKTKPVVDTKW